MVKNKIHWNVLIFSFIIVFGIVGLIGSLFTSGETNSEWYSSTKTFLTPPNWVFPLVWNILFILIAFSLYFVWVYSNKKQKKTVVIVYGMNFLFNMIWSFLFFKLKNPILAFIDILFVLITIILMIFVSGKIKKISSWMLIPYLLWVGFASILNGLIAFGK